jgi:hypothetical protein
MRNKFHQEHTHNGSGGGESKVAVGLLVIISYALSSSVFIRRMEISC